MCHSKKGLDEVGQSVWGWGALDGVQGFPVGEHDEGRCHADVVVLRGSPGLFRVNLDDLDLASEALGERSKVGLELSTWGTRRREKLDEHKAWVLKNLLRERRIVGVVEHCGILPRDK